MCLTDKSIVKKRFKALIFPIIFLCTISAYSSYSLIFSQKNSKSTRQKQTRVLAQPKSRAIASVAVSKTIDFDCSQQNQVAKIASAQVFIKFKHCDSKQKNAEFKLVNQTNKYMAQIFRPSYDLITTDFIQLARGENILKLEISLNGEQKKTQIIKIDRISSEIQ